MLKDIIILISYLISWPTTLVFVLSLFRFKIKPFITQIAFSSVILANISLLLQNTHFIFLLSSLQFICALLCLWLLFKIPFYHSFFMMIVGFIFMLITEWLMNLLLPITIIQTVSLDNIGIFFWSVLLMDVWNWLIICLLRKFRLGFSFIPSSHRKGKFNYTGNPLLFTIILIGLLVTFFSSIALFINPKIYAVLCLISFPIIGILIRISYNWELSD